MNTHLLPNGHVPLQLRLMSDGKEAWRHDFALSISNTGPLAEKVPTALVQFHNGQKRLISPAEAQGDPQLLALMKQQRSLPVHAAQLYSTLTCFILAALLVAYFSMPHVAGRVFALMLMLEGITRFLLELLRVEPPVIGSFSLSMILGLMLVGLGIILWVGFGRFRRVVVPMPAAAATA